MAFSDNSKVVKIEENNIDELKSKGQLLVIDFWATWCGPCRKLSSTIEEIAGEVDNTVIIGQCNIEDNDKIAVDYSIHTLPTLLFIKNGQELADGRIVGLVSKKDILNKINACK